MGQAADKHFPQLSVDLFIWQEGLFGNVRHLDLAALGGAERILVEALVHHGVGGVRFLVGVFARVSDFLLLFRLQKGFWESLLALNCFVADAVARNLQDSYDARVVLEGYEAEASRFAVPVENNDAVVNGPELAEVVNEVLLGRGREEAAHEYLSTFKWILFLPSGWSRCPLILP